MFGQNNKKKQARLRLLYDFLLVLAFLILPWFAILILALMGIVMFRWFWVGLFLLLFSDIIYSVYTQGGLAGFYLSWLFVIVLVSFELWIKPQTRMYEE